MHSYLIHDCAMSSRTDVWLHVTKEYNRRANDMDNNLMRLALFLYVPFKSAANSGDRLPVLLLTVCC